MLSSQLALRDLEAVEDGNPFIATRISQSDIIEALRKHRKFKKAWNKALEHARDLVTEDGIVAITVYQLSLKKGYVTRKNIDIRKSRKFFILWDNESLENDPIICASVSLVLFK